MVDTLLFVHGTGVRKASMLEIFESIKKGLSKAGRSDIKVDWIDWGEQEGTDVSSADIDDILPLGEAKDVTGAPDAEALEAALWAELLKDPLFELRVAGMRAPPKVPGGNVVLPGGPALPEVELSANLLSFRQTIPDGLPGGVSASSIRSAADWLLTQKTVLVDAAQAAGDAADLDLSNAVARAIVAKALTEARGEIGAGPDALYLVDERTALVAAVASLLSPDFKGLGGWLVDKIKGFALAGATHYGKKRRDDLMHGISPGVGDILLYQRRGEKILDLIENKIVTLAGKGKIVALGHSLGGIMLVDLLTRPRVGGPLPVAALITVASQSPMFLKCDALLNLLKGKPDGIKPFTPWLNIYDRNDFLSFCATRTFKGLKDIEDFEVKSGVPFPDSHGAYFRMKEVYAKIVKEWPKNE